MTPEQAGQVHAVDQIKRRKLPEGVKVGSRVSFPHLIVPILHRFEPERAGISGKLLRGRAGHNRSPPRVTVTLYERAAVMRDRVPVSAGRRMGHGNLHRGCDGGYVAVLATLMSTVLLQLWQRRFCQICADLKPAIRYPVGGGLQYL